MVQGLSESETRAWRTLVRATFTMRDELDRELSLAHSITLAEYEVLAALAEAPRCAMRMSDLAAQLHTSPSGMTRRIDGLVQHGWVERVQCTEDRRGSYAVLTEQGNAALKQAAPTHVHGLRMHLINRLSERQLESLTSALEAVD